ncbi:MAG: response regulator [Thermoanaerobaculia bacterium]
MEPRRDDETPRRVLIADDDPSIRRLLETLVCREKIELDTASDGAEAIRLLEQNEYGVILLDLMMPNVNGFGVIEWLRANPRQEKAVVFVISAYADEAIRQVDTTIVAGVIHKPFDVSDVASLIRHIVHGWDEELARSLKQSQQRAIRDYVISKDPVSKDPATEH